MKVTCVREKLKSALDTSERVISKNTTLPILNNILLETKKNSLYISSTNLEIGITSYLSCKVIQEGSITVPAKVFSGIINNISSDTIELEVKKDTTLSVSAGSYSGELKGQDATEFPIIPKLKKGSTLILDAHELSQGLSRVIPVTASSETRPELTGVLFRKNVEEKDTVYIAATDSFRLSEKKLPIKKAVGKEFLFIVPHKTASEVLRLASGKDEIELTIEENQVSFSLEGVEIISRLIEGNYPDYQKLIPKTFSTELVLDKDEAVKTVRLVGLLSSRINDIKLSLEKKGENTIVVHASDPDLGENTASVSVESSGEPIDVRFNWHYLMDGLQFIDDARVVLKLTDETKPALIQSPKDTSYLYVVMPIRM